MLGDLEDWGVVLVAGGWGVQNGAWRGWGEPSLILTW